eukprot:gene34268-40096_t
MADTQEERLKRDEQIRETIMAKLVESGEKDKLKEMLRDRLVQCGWRDELKEYCKEVIRRKGLEKVTVEELVAEITPHGRGNNGTGRSQSGAIEENSSLFAIHVNYAVGNHPDRSCKFIFRSGCKFHRLRFVTTKMARTTLRKMTHIERYHTFCNLLNFITMWLWQVLVDVLGSIYTAE